MRPWKVVTTLGLLGILVAWLLTPLTIRFVDWLGGGDSLTSLGPLGDTFGATSALFNGLAFLGLVVVLVYEMEERRRDLALLDESIKEQHRRMRPYLVPQITRPSAARVTRAEWDNGEVVVEVSVSIEVTNATGDVALNATIEAHLSTDSGESRMHGGRVPVGLPVGPTDTREVTYAFSERGAPARAALSSMANHGSLALTVRLEYQALNALKWASTATYTLTLEGGGSHQANEVMKKNDEFFVDRRTPIGLPFESQVDSTSWTHEKVE